MIEIKHKDSCYCKLIEIARLKNKAWPKYSVGDHLLWMYENLKEKDIHILYYLDNVLCAYMNYICVKVKIDGKNEEITGVGNLCSLADNFAGFQLMKDCMRDKKYIGFCKDELLSYYDYLGWKY